MISSFIQSWDQCHLDQERNAGPSHAQDLLEFMPTSSKLSHLNSKKDYGVTITLMLKENAGERNQ